MHQTFPALVSGHVRLFSEIPTNSASCSQSGSTITDHHAAFLLTQACATDIRPRPLVTTGPRACIVPLLLSLLQDKLTYYSCRLALTRA